MAPSSSRADRAASLVAKRAAAEMRAAEAAAAKSAAAAEKRAAEAAAAEMRAAEAAAAVASLNGSRAVKRGRTPDDDSSAAKSVCAMAQTPDVCAAGSSGAVPETPVSRQGEMSISASPCALSTAAEDRRREQSEADARAAEDAERERQAEIAQRVLAALSDKTMWAVRKAEMDAVDAANRARELAAAQLEAERQADYDAADHQMDLIREAVARDAIAREAAARERRARLSALLRVADAECAARRQELEVVRAALVVEVETEVQRQLASFDGSNLSHRAVVDAILLCVSRGEYAMQPGASGQPTIVDGIRLPLVRIFAARELARIDAAFDASGL